MEAVSNLCNYKVGLGVLDFWGGKNMIFNFLLWIFPQIQICSQISIYINKILAQ